MGNPAESRVEASAAPEREAPAVAIAGVARRLGHRWALRSATLRVEAGEVVALVGHNGSGKTTLLRILATLLRPTRGDGRVCGLDLVQDAYRIRERIALLGHSPGLYGDLTAHENLEFCQRMCGQPPDAAAIRTALERVGLERDADERVRTFSSGMQRRLALARILIRRAELVLFDEPFASFDADGVARVNDFLAEHKARGGSAVVATHDLGKAAAVIDRVWSITTGRTQGPFSPSDPAFARPPGVATGDEATDGEAIRAPGLEPQAAVP